MYSIYEIKNREECTGQKCYTKSSEGVSTGPNKWLSHIVSGSFLKETLASDTYKID